MILPNFDVFVCLGPVWGALGLTSNLFGPFGMIQTCLVASGTNRDAFRMHLGAHEANPLILGCSELAHACKGPRGLENPCLSEYWSFVGDKLLHPCLLRCFFILFNHFPIHTNITKAINHCCRAGYPRAPLCLAPTFSTCAAGGLPASNASKEWFLRSSSNFGSNTILAQVQLKLTCVATLMTLTTPQLQAVQKHPTHQTVLLAAAHPWIRLSTKLVQLGG